MKLQYHICPGNFGLMSTTYCDQVSVSERLNRLFTREQRWAESKFDFRRVVEVRFSFLNFVAKSPAGFFYEVVEEVQFRYIRVFLVRRTGGRVGMGEDMVLNGLRVPEHDPRVPITASRLHSVRDVPWHLRWRE
ncbi:hypothetical protein P691DRAFT_470521 [Macrolepiota fuliginosa MF-IS2]|uniref:Uncharacterized protein n=1 Tax=Macrolepiota fuliginosa MF-IS2 TaxID=1400762 RepID=A0A9P6BW74_9AGAR|nr:hypothetical protein P691DRAFT_470521 [Macrolepiota fuliginosa MF-IS2]